MRKNINPEMLYKKLIELMNDVILMTDKKGCIVYTNPKFSELTGYSAKDVLGKETYMFWDEESIRRIKRINETERKNGISSSYEATVLRKDGKMVPVFVSGSPLLDGGTIGIVTDLSELKKKESLYRKIIEHMNEALLIGDINECTTYANPKFCSMLGYSLEEILGKSGYDFLDDACVKKVRHINTHYRKRGLSSSYEATLVSKDGTKIPVYVSGAPLPDGGTIGFMTDLTELKKKEETERILTQAIALSNDAVVTLDHTGKICSWNKGAKIVFGYKDEEMIGESLTRIFSQEDVDNILKHTQVIYNFELRGTHKNKSYLDISTTVTPIFFESSVSPSFYYVLIARDITSKTKFEEELALKYQKMQEAYNKFGIIRRQMDYMIDMLDLCASYHDFQNVADFIVSSVIMLTRVDACVLRVHNEKKETLDLVSYFGLSDDWKGKAIVRYKNSIAEKAFNKKMPLKIIDVAREPRYHSPYLAKKHHVSSLLLIPLVFQSKLIGTLSLYARPERKLEIFENEFIEKYAKLIEVVVGALFKKVDF